jgi:hypothetical protein
VKETTVNEAFTKDLAVVDVIETFPSEVNSLFPVAFSTVNERLIVRGNELLALALVAVNSPSEVGVHVAESLVNDGLVAFLTSILRSLRMILRTGKSGILGVALK